MSREDNFPDKIALLATGDEISNGDILNTNSQEIAQRLMNQGMHVGMHMATPDSISEIEQAIRFLLKSHRALIMTGGLGPTSDDLTRFALGKAIDRELIFDEPTWNAICDRLKKFGYPTPPQSNRQQALFPAGANIIPNPNGTAAGCQLQFGNQWIFMLPGPPPECLPMLENAVLPTLVDNGLQHILRRRSWLLFGVSEGQIAEELDQIAKPFQCTTGYRLCYPYIEFKLHSNHENDFVALVPLIEKAIAPYLIADGKQTASAFLQKKLEKINWTLGIADLATGGLLESTIKTPENFTQLYFSSDENFPIEMPYVVIKGLSEYWEGKNNLMDAQIELTFVNQHSTSSTQTKIPFRGKRVKQFALEYICHQISLFLPPMN
jgi:nicotinamide-nucleotide amidase